MLDLIDGFERKEMPLKLVDGERMFVHLNVMFVKLRERHDDTQEHQQDDHRSDGGFLVVSAHYVVVSLVPGLVHRRQNVAVDSRYGSE